MMDCKHHNLDLATVFLAARVAARLRELIAENLIPAGDAMTNPYAEVKE